MSFLEQASDAIRDSGGRMTGQRRLIIELLETMDAYLDAERLYDLARERDSSVSLATVYRTLNVLEEAGLVHQRYLSREHDRKLYEPIHVEEEYHFTCRKCRRVIPFHSEHIQSLKRHLEAELGIQVVNACVCFDGLCSTCRVQAADRQPARHDKTATGGLDD